MFEWIGDHYIALIVVVAALLFGRNAFNWLVSNRSKTAGGSTRGSMASGFCNKCGWTGKVGRTSQACGKCGSGKITLRTN